MAGLDDFGISSLDNTPSPAAPSAPSGALASPSALRASPEMVGGIPMDVYRVIAQEGGDPASIAAEIANRSRLGKQSLYDVVHSAGQYGPGSPSGSNENQTWRTQYADLPSNAPSMQRAISIGGPILRGEVPNPYPNYTYHYSPAGMEKYHGGKTPSWVPAGVQGENRGGNVMFSLPYGGGKPSPGQDIWGDSGIVDLDAPAQGAAAPQQKAAPGSPAAQPAAPATAAPQGYNITDDSGKVVGQTNPAQTAGILADTGRTGKGDAGTRGNPFGYGPGQVVGGHTFGFQGGQWYYDPTTGKPTQYKDPDTLGQTLQSVASLVGNPAGMIAENEARNAMLVGGVDPGAILPARMDPRTQAAVEGFTNNALFGAQSKLEGAASALVGGNNYQTATAAADAYRQGLRERFPGVYNTAAVSGAIAPMVIGGEAAEAAARTAGEGSNIAKGLRFLTGTQAADTAPGRLLLNAPGAATTAAVQGFASGLGGSRADTLGGQLGEAGAAAAQSAAGGAFMHGLVGAGGPLASGVRNLFPNPAAEGRASDQLFRNLAQLGGSIDPRDWEIESPIPGVTRTSAQAGNNAALATQERSIVGGPANAEAKARLDRQTQANQAARNAFVEPMQPSPATAATMDRDAEAAIAPHRDAVFAGAKPADSMPAVNAVNDALKTPEGQEPSVRATLEKAQSRLGGQSEGLTPAEQRQANLEITGQMGVPSETMSRKVMGDAYTANQQTFQRIARETKIDTPSLQQLDTDFGNLKAEARTYLGAAGAEPVENVADAIRSVMVGGRRAPAVTGEGYLALTEKGGLLDRAEAGATPTTRAYIRQMRGLLDDALQRSASPADQAALTTARSQWRAMKQVEDATRDLPPGSDIPVGKLASGIRSESFSHVYGGHTDALGDIAEKWAAQAQPRFAPENNPAVLHGIRSDIADQINSGKDHTGALGKVRDSLDDVIESAAPGYKAFSKARDDAYAPANAARYLSTHYLTGAGSGNVTMEKVGAALRTIDKDRSAPGMNGAKAISPEVIDNLRALHGDLQVAARSGLGRGAGSDTAQKLLNRYTQPTSLPPWLKTLGIFGGPKSGALTFLTEGAMNAANARNQRVLSGFQNRLISAPEGAAALERANAAAAGGYRPGAPGATNKLLRTVAAAGPRVQASPEPKRPSLVVTP